MQRKVLITIQKYFFQLTVKYINKFAKGLNI